ncbi:MAG TPA: hypothetical protein VFQ36_22210 [Ktedonobacteraceae bacterium]|nr:hypothetical protein [Ktedonobacteraceae bacterium]
MGGPWPSITTGMRPFPNRAFSKTDSLEAQLVGRVAPSQFGR